MEHFNREVNKYKKIVKAWRISKIKAKQQMDFIFKVTSALSAIKTKRQKTAISVNFVLTIKICLPPKYYCKIKIRLTKFKIYRKFVYPVHPRAVYQEFMDHSSKAVLKSM